MNSFSTQTPNQDMQAPPSYDAAMKDITCEPQSPSQKDTRADSTGCAASGPFVTNGTSTADSVKVPLPEGTPAQGPSPQVPSMPATTVYNYVNPITQEQIVSLLPPDHPQMICLQQGGHVPRTHYGVLGE